MADLGLVNVDETNAEELEEWNIKKPTMVFTKIDLKMDDIPESETILSNNNNFNNNTTFNNNNNNNQSIYENKPINVINVINVIKNQLKRKEKNDEKAVSTDEIAAAFKQPVGMIYPFLVEYRKNGDVLEPKPDRWMVLE
jgi:hypothetical protein